MKRCAKPSWGSPCTTAANQCTADQRHPPRSGHTRDIERVADADANEDPPIA